MLYELVTLTGPLLKASEIESSAQEAMARAPAGTLLGCWRTEHGVLGRVILLRAFETPDTLAQERRRVLLDPVPFGLSRIVETIEMESYEAFPFLPPVVPRKAGGVYEFRTYRLKPGGLAPTLKGWEAAILPAKEYTDHLIVNMFALDGRPRITHIWGFESLEQRSDLRRRHYASGLWPPKGGPEQIDQAISVIALASEGSPLC